LTRAALGDEGAAGTNTGYTWKTQGEKDKDKQVGPDGFRFVLTHGDIVTLSGDYFDPREQDDNGQPIPDSLFRLASTPSSDPGKKPGTQDEILYALKKHAGNDWRFRRECTPEHPTPHPYSFLEFSPEVEKAVETRYLKLASRNDEHFQHPQGPTSGGPSSQNRSSGGGSYRALHEDAIMNAYESKKRGSDADAMAHEAAAQHFLTDAFAAGHARTPRGSIRSHWQAKYPLFFSNLKKAIAHETAIWINSNDTNAATIGGNVMDITAGIFEKVDAQTQDLPAFGFDDVVSLVVHDIDNERGLWVTNDLGDRWLTYGDGSLDKGGTKQHAMQAVNLGCQDIQTAYSLEEGMTKDQVLAAVRARTPAPGVPGEKYGPEQVIPREDPSMPASNGKQNWEADSFESLWKLPVRTDDPSTTFETVISESLKGGELHEKLGGLAEKFPASEEVWKSIGPSWLNRDRQTYLGTLHPQAGYLNGFFNPIVENPYEGMRRIIHYNPARGQASHNTDDAVRADLDAMDKQDQADKKDAHSSMHGLTLEQRVSNTRELLEGNTSEGEGERIAQMFETASRSDALEMFKRIEGHAWEGDFRNGWLTIDDDLWDDLTRDQLSRIRAHLNGG